MCIYNICFSDLPKNFVESVLALVRDRRNECEKDNIHIISGDYGDQCCRNYAVQCQRDCGS